MLVERYRFNRESLPVEKAAEYLFTFQTREGDIRGFIGNQYATHYTGYVLALLMQAGYVNDPRIERSIQWLLKMRQDDGGCTVPTNASFRRQDDVPVDIIVRGASRAGPNLAVFPQLD
jgi:hypothetical protein